MQKGVELKKPGLVCCLLPRVDWHGSHTLKGCALGFPHCEGGGGDRSSQSNAQHTQQVDWVGLGAQLVIKRSHSSVHVVGQRFASSSPAARCSLPHPCPSVSTPPTTLSALRPCADQQQCGSIRPKAWPCGLLCLA